MAAPIETWFNPEFGALHRLDLAGLPQQRGGPSAVRIELLEERDLGSDFFSHTSHHGPDREVIEESPSRFECAAEQVNPGSIASLAGANGRCASSWPKPRLRPVSQFSRQGKRPAG